jgi:hypothetical protein
MGVEEVTVFMPRARGGGGGGGTLELARLPAAVAGGALGWEEEGGGGGGSANASAPTFPGPCVAPSAEGGGGGFEDATAESSLLVFSVCSSRADSLSSWIGCMATSALSCCRPCCESLSSKQVESRTRTGALCLRVDFSRAVSFSSCLMASCLACFRPLACWLCFCCRLRCASSSIAK